MDFLLSLKLDHHIAHFLVNLGEVSFLLPALDVQLDPETVDQLTQLGVLVEELRVVLEQDFQLGPKVVACVLLPGLVDLFVEVGGADFRRLLAEVGEPAD